MRSLVAQNNIKPWHYFSVKFIEVGAKIGLTPIQ
jgi:hypothetical protein